MDAAELRATQAPIKERYKSDPAAAVITLKAKGSIENEGIACKVETGRAGRVCRNPPAFRRRHICAAGQTRFAAQTHRALLRGLPDHQEWSQAFGDDAKGVN